MTYDIINKVYSMPDMTHRTPAMQCRKHNVGLLTVTG